MSTWSRAPSLPSPTKMESMRSKAFRRATTPSPSFTRNSESRTRRLPSLQKIQRRSTRASKPRASSRALFDKISRWIERVAVAVRPAPPSLQSASRGPNLKAVTTTYDRGHHRLAVILAGWTFLLIIAGALVTSNDAGLSVPDWPTSFGSWYKIPRLVGGVKFEHTHRMIAQVAGLLTLILAIWTWRVEKRRWLRILALAAVGTVIAQGILGGLTVLFYLPPAISSAHAALAQTFFCVVVLIAVFTGRRWMEEVPRIEDDDGRPSLFTLAGLSIFVLLSHLFL